MKVELRRNWFSPTEVYQRDKFFSLSGQRWKKGVHEMPDILFNYLPSTAKVIEPPKDGVNEDVLPECKAPEANPLHENDIEREVGKKMDQAQEALQARLAKARAAKAAKAARK